MSWDDNDLYELCNLIVASNSFFYANLRLFSLYTSEFHGVGGKGEPGIPPPPNSQKLLLQKVLYSGKLW